MMPSADTSSNAIPQNGDLEAGGGTGARKTQAKKRWTIWRILGWGFLGVLMLLLIVAAYVWTHRYTLIEDMMKSVLSEQGVEAELSIDGIGKKRAELSAIDLRAQGQSIFSVDRIVTDYDWRDALNGSFNRLEFTGAKLRLTLDEKGQIIDGWMPTTDESGTQTQLPKDGIFMRGASVTLATPYGEIVTRGDLIVRSKDDITADLTIQPSAVQYQDMRADVGGPVTLRVKDGVVAVNTTLDVPRFFHPEISASDGTVRLETRFAVAPAAQTMPLSIDAAFSTLRHDSASAEQAALSWTGPITLDTARQPLSANGVWAVDISGASVSDADGRRALSRRIATHETLLATPIAQGFAPGFGTMVEALLGQADISASGGVDWDKGGAAMVSLDGPLSWTAEKASLRVTPKASGDAVPLYRFDPQSELVNIAGDVTFSGRYPMRLRDLVVVANSRDGVSVDGVQRVTGSLQRGTAWTGQYDGRDIRLGASTLDLDLRETATGLRARIKGPLDLDGLVPGGYVQGLTLDGRLDVAMVGPNMTVDFAPKDGVPLTLSRFENLTDWTATNVSFMIGQSAEPLLKRTASSSTINANARDISGLLTEAETGRALTFRVAGMDATGALQDTQQDWEMHATSAKITTDDILSEGTVMSAPAPKLSAVLRADEDTQFMITATKARLESALLSLRDMPLTMSGTSENFTVDYGRDGLSTGEAGMVRLSGDTLPPLPLIGQVIYNNGAFVGQAKTVLPKAEDTEILVDYAFEDGAGTAKVVIPELRFARGALQPQNLVKAFQGKIADVNGTVSAEFDLAFKTGQPLQSSGSARIRNLDFGTLPGPFTGVNTDLEFTSIFPLVTSGTQTMTVDLFDPGFPLADGEISYELIDGGLEIISATWPIGSGTMSLKPTTWLYDAPSNQVVLSIDNVSLGAFVERYGGGNLRATGDVVGTIPVTVEGVNVLVNNGIIGVRDGGLIQYINPNLVPTVDIIPGEFVTLQDYQQFQEIKKNGDPDSSLGRGAAFKALRNFQYRTLEARIDGPLGGEVELKVGFIGKNPKILAGTEFDFNITLVGELLTIARNLKVANNMDAIKGYLNLDSDTPPSSDGPSDNPGEGPP